LPLRLPVGRIRRVTDQAAAGFASKPTLAGEKVVLRPFTEDDLPALRMSNFASGTAGAMRSRAGSISRSLIRPAASAWAR
jgi:hypothetical protein